ncbi:MAG TPA: hypothetical protein VN445_14925 [Rectinemataceae bacterium]|nr:hypothetical protein [Rectinemataceae bacterium]
MNPFAFEPLDSPLARVSAASKAILLICASTAAMRFGALPLALLLATGALLMPVLRIPLKGLGKASMVIGYLALFSAIVRGIFPGDGRVFALETIPLSALYSARLGTVFIYARIYYVSTKASELGDYLSVAARKMTSLFGKKGGRSIVLSDPGMMASLSLLFLPRVFENYGKVRDAAELRGFGIGRRWMSGMLPMLQTFVFTSIKGALSTARAMELRGYSEARTISLRAFSRFDAAIVASGGLLLLLSGLGV